MSFGEDQETYDEELQTGCRSLSPLPSDVTRTSNELRAQKHQSQNQNQQNMASLLNKFINKDKETENLRKENQSLKDKLKEFEYLIIKGSEEVKRKQGEIASLNSIIDGLKQAIPNAATIDTLQRQLEQSQRELLKIKSESAQAQTKLRIEVQKEKELNTGLSKQVNEMREKLEVILQDSKVNTEDLQKSFSMTSQKYMQLERDFAEARKLVQELQQENEVKNQTLDHAHEVISRLKQEVEEFSGNCTAAQSKVKEYKSKNKTLKKSNANLKEQIKAAEPRLKEFDEMKEDLARVREENQSLIRAKIEERMRNNGKMNDQTQEKETLQKSIFELKDKVSMLEKENTSLSTRLSETMSKYQDMTSCLHEKDKELNKVQEQYKQDLVTFRTNAARSCQVWSQGPEAQTNLYSRQGSPFKTANLMDSGIGRMGRRNSGAIKTTPIKHYSSKGVSGPELKNSYQENSEINNISIATSFSLLNQVEGLKVGNRLGVSGNDKEMDIGELSNDKEVQKEEEPKELLSVVFLQEELQRSIDREHYLILMIETLFRQGEFEVKEFADKLEQHCILNNEAEELQAKNEDYELKYKEILEKYKEAQNLIADFTENNKALTERLEKLLEDYNKLSQEYKDQSKLFIEEQTYYQSLNKEIIKDSNDAINSFNSAMANKIEKVNSDAMKKFSNEYEKQEEQIKNLEELIEGLIPQEGNQNFQNALRDTKSSNLPKGSPFRRADQKENTSPYRSTGSSLSSKLSKKLEMYDAKIKQLQEEKTELNNKLMTLKVEVRDWKKESDNNENEYKIALSDRDQTISRVKEDAIRKEELLKEMENNFKKAQMMLAEKENMINEQGARLSEWNEKDMSLHNILQEREDRIRELMKYRQDLCGKLDDINALCINLKKDLSDREREIDHKEEIIADLESELRIKDEELGIKEGELDDKNDQIYELENIISLKDKDNAKLRADVVDLRNHVFELKEENIRIEYAYNMGQTESIPTRNSYFIGTGNLSLTEKQEMRETNTKHGYSGRSERRSVPTIKKGEIQDRPSENMTIHENEMTIRQLREENYQLVQENNDLFDKLNRLNELLSHNKELEKELDELKNGQATKVGMDSFDKSMINVDSGKDSASTGCFDNIYLEKCLQTQDDNQQEREMMRQLKEKTKDSAAAQYIEKYKAKTKKIFSKRVKELEILLRFIDQKIKGYHFNRASFIVCSVTEPTPLSQEEVKTNAKLTFLVDNLLEKNHNLKNFVEDFIKRIEQLYTKTHNLSALLGKLVKILLTTHSEHGFDGLSEALPEIEAFSRVQVPDPVDNFNQIETVIQDANSFRLEYFKLFAKVEPKMNILVENLIKNMKFANQRKTDSFSFAVKAEDYLTSKVEKIREVEDLYEKLKDIILKNSNSLGSLPEHVQGYLQTYSNICEAIMNEVKPILNFTSNVLTENSTHHEINQSHPSLYKGIQALSEVKPSNIPVSNRTSSHKLPTSAKKDIQNLNLNSTNQFSVDLTNRRLKFSANKSPQREKQLFRSKPSSFTPSKQEEIGHLTSVQSEYVGKENEGATQKLSFGDLEESNNQRMRTSRY